MSDGPATKLSLLAVPNVSEGRDFERLEKMERSLGGQVTLLDRHTDIDHHRAVFTVAGPAGNLAAALIGLASTSVSEIDMTEWQGVHPAIGALDVCPVVWLSEERKSKAAEVAREVGEAIGVMGVPVFLYGDVASDNDRRERAYFRAGGLDSLWQRMVSGNLRPDFGPDRPHPTAGATLVTARAPLAAFNIELATDDVRIARAIAGEIREQPDGGIPGVRALGLELSTGRAQVSTNIHDPIGTPLGEIVEAVQEGAMLRGTNVVEAELIGLIPQAALEDYPDDVPIREFDPAFHIIERRIEPT
ncbi:MAG: glutamate formiminotransferase [Solirubrobacterales bacterium]|nr:glutamate formiminotransferase [Solirubrobacterales bacterium]